MWKAAAICLSVFLRSAKKSFVSLPGVVSFSTALLYSYRTSSITIGLSLYSYRFGFVVCYLNTVFLSFLCVLCVSLSLCAAGMPRGKRLKSQTKEVVMSVYRYFEKMERKTKRRNATSQSALKRTSKATSK